MASAMCNLYRCWLIQRTYFLILLKSGDSSKLPELATYRSPCLWFRYRLVCVVTRASALSPSGFWFFPISCNTSTTLCSELHGWIVLTTLKQEWGGSKSNCYTLQLDRKIERLIDWLMDGTMDICIDRCKSRNFLFECLYHLRPRLALSTAQVLAVMFFVACPT